MFKIALLGNPNAGKTTLFNALTGSTQHVGNWPGVTVEKKEGVYSLDKNVFTIIDLPGVYSLSPYTIEEKVTRSVLLEQDIDAVINLVDASNLERNLYLTTQLLEMDVPVYIALNMADVLEREEKWIDIEKLKACFGVPVFLISALKKTGIKEMMATIAKEQKKSRQGVSLLEAQRSGAIYEKIYPYTMGHLHRAFITNKLLEGDQEMIELWEINQKEVQEICATFHDADFDNDLVSCMAHDRYQAIANVVSNVVSYKNAKKKPQESRSDRIDRVVTHRVFGLPIFLMILFLVFHFTFSEDLFFLHSLGIIDWTSFEGSFFEGVLASGGLASPGILFARSIEACTGGLTTVVEQSLSFAPLWVQGFLLEGVLAGVFAVVGFLPQILVLFFFFSLIEDSGYMARIAFLLDRIFRRFGLSGRAFLPMMMGFGCSVPAMMNTRTLGDEKERIATIRVIPFFSCGAKLPILTAIAGGIVMLFGIPNADLITYGMYLLGMITAIISVLIMRHTVLKGEGSPFIMELPAYRRPQLRSLVFLLWDKTKHFLKKACTILLVSTMFIWVISHFSWSFSYLSSEQIDRSILASIGKLFLPLFTPLGFGSQLTNWGWVFLVAAITGLIAKENVIATFGTLAACIAANFEGTEDGLQAVVVMIQATGISLPALLSFIAFNMLTIPCFAAVATAKAELPKKRFLTTLLFWIFVSYTVSMMIYWIGSKPWTVLIFLFLFLTGGIGLWFLTRKKVNKCKSSKL